MITSTSGLAKETRRIADTGRVWFNRRKRRNKCSSNTESSIAITKSRVYTKTELLYNKSKPVELDIIRKKKWNMILKIPCLAYYNSKID